LQIQDPTRNMTRFEVCKTVRVLIRVF